MEPKYPHKVRDDSYIPGRPLLMGELPKGGGYTKKVIKPILPIDTRMDALVNMLLHPSYFKDPDLKLIIPEFKNIDLASFPPAAF